MGANLHIGDCLIFPTILFTHCDSCILGSHSLALYFFQIRSRIRRTALINFLFYSFEF